MNPSTSSHVLGRMLMFTVLAIAVCLAGWMAMPLLLGSHRMLGDLLSYHYPIRWAYRESLLHGHSFLWNPWVGCGTHIHAEGQAGMCHPFHLLLYRFVNADTGLDIEVLFGYVFAIVGGWLFFRRWGLRHSISLWGGCLYAFCPMNLSCWANVNIVTIMAHAPWALWMLDIMLTGTTSARRRAGTICLALIIGSELLLGYPQATAMCGFIGSAYLLALVLPRAWRGGLRFQWGIVLNGFAAFAAANLLGLALGAAQALPHLDMFFATERAQPPAGFRFGYSADVRGILEIFAGPLGVANPLVVGAYAGIPALFAAIWGLSSLRRLRAARGGGCQSPGSGGLPPQARSLQPLFLFSLLCIFLGIAMALGQSSPVYRAVSSLPVLSSFRSPYRYLYIVHYGVICLAATGLSSVFERRSDVRASMGGFLPALALLAAVLATTLCAAARLNESWFPWCPPGPQLFWVPLVAVMSFFVFCACIRGWRWAVILLPLLQACDVGFYMNRVAQIPAVSEWPRTVLARDVVPPSDPGGQRVYHRLVESEPVAGNNLSTLFGIRNAVGYTGVALRDSCLHYVPENANTLRVAAVDWVRGSCRKDSPWMPLADPLPPVRLLSKVVVSPDPAGIIESTDVRHVAVVEKEIQELDPNAEPGTATIVSQTPGEYGIRTSCKTRQLLVLSERHWPQWRVTMDQQSGPELLRVYGDFMGCVVPAGTHVIQFRFVPVSFRIGVLVSLLALGGCLGGLCVLPRLRQGGGGGNAARCAAGPPSDESVRTAGQTAGPFETDEVPTATADARRRFRRGAILCSACLVLVALAVGAAMFRESSSFGEYASRCGRNLHLGYALTRAGVMDAIGSMAGAESAYRDVLNCEPGNDTIRIRLGAVLIRRGKAEDGLKLIKEAASPESDNAGDAAEACAAAARACMAAGDAPSAAAAFRCALSLTPQVMGYRAELAGALDAAGEEDAALEEYRAVVAGAPESPKSSARIDAILDGRGDRAARAEEWRRVASVHPTAALPHLHLGLALEMSGDAAGARAALEKALRINPALAEARDALGRLDGAASRGKE